LAAILAPILLVRHEQLFLSVSNPYLWGAAAAITAAFKTENIYWTIGAGMLVFVATGQLI
jgi:branched-subunit amino acid transport protein